MGPIMNTTVKKFVCYNFVPGHVQKDTGLLDHFFLTLSPFFTAPVAVTSNTINSVHVTHYTLNFVVPRRPLSEFFGQL